MLSLVQTKAVVDKILKSVLSKTGLIFSIAEALAKIVDGSVDNYSLRHMGEILTTVGEDEPSIESLLPSAARPSKILYDSESHREPHRSRCRRSRSSCPNCRGK